MERQASVPYRNRNGSNLVKGGIFFLGAISVMLCVSLIMAVFTPFPISLATVLYGRMKGMLLGLICSIVVFALGWKVAYGPVIFGIYILSWVFSFFISEIILQKKDPLKGFLTFGWILVGLVGIFFGLKIMTLEGGLKNYLLKSTQVLSSEIKRDESRLLEMKGEEARELLDVFSRPEILVDEIIDFIPKVLFIGVFFFLWVNLLLLLRAHHFYRPLHGYPYTEKDLLRFKVPDYIVWPVLVCLMAVIIGEPTFGKLVPTLGKNGLYGFGLFYFFQGFGIYTEFLDTMKIAGFFRSLLVMFTIVSGYWILVMIGLFDMWVNFRKFFKNKEV